MRAMGGHRFEAEAANAYASIPLESVKTRVQHPTAELHKVRNTLATRVPFGLWVTRINSCLVVGEVSGLTGAPSGDDYVKVIQRNEFSSDAGNLGVVKKTGHV